MQREEGHVDPDRLLRIVKLSHPDVRMFDWVPPGRTLAVRGLAAELANAGMLTPLQRHLLRARREHTRDHDANH